VLGLLKLAHAAKTMLLEVGATTKPRKVVPGGQKFPGENKILLESSIGPKLVLSHKISFI
jgi:hypothetical protein